MDDDVPDSLISPSRGRVTVHRLEPEPYTIDASGLVDEHSIPQHLNIGDLPIQPHALPGPNTLQYHGAKWDHNSCWFDSGEFEALYLISRHDQAFWQWPHGNLAIAFTSRICDFQRAFATRDLIHMYADRKVIPTLLSQVRTGIIGRLAYPEADPVIRNEHLHESQPLFVSPSLVQLVPLLNYSIACSKNSIQPWYRGNRLNQLLLCHADEETLLCGQSRFQKQDIWAHRFHFHQRVLYPTKW